MTDLALTDEPGWTLESYAIHAAMLRQADIRFDEERDRRYTEVNIEKEKALKIKETADLAALSLARESQTYKEQQNDALRDKNLSESGVYATNTSLSKVADEIRVSTDKSITDLANSTSKAIGDLVTKLEPLISGRAQDQGQTQGSQISKANLYAALGGVGILVGIVFAFRPAG